jgi:hypothetical protein
MLSILLVLFSGDAKVVIVQPASKVEVKKTQDALPAKVETKTEVKAQLVREGRIRWARRAKLIISE